MFTGLVEQMGRIVSVDPTPHGCTRLVVAAAFDDLVCGESVSIEGACMSVADLGQRWFGVDVMPESLARSTLSQLRPESPVNLERALRVGDRLGGHFVSGHVDGVARVETIRRSGQDHRVLLHADPRWMRYLAVKGSVTLAGVSLTISALDPRGFEVALIPLTLERTTLGLLREGARVNLELDLVARYLERLIRSPNNEGQPDE